MADKCTECPECGSDDFTNVYEIDEHARVCNKCGQEWHTTVNYKKYSSDRCYFEAYTVLGMSFPEKDRRGDANSFDKRSIKRRIKKLLRLGFNVNAFNTKRGEPRRMIFSSFTNTRTDLIGIDCLKAVN